MERRTLLQGVGGVFVAGSAGCSGLLGGKSGASADCSVPEKKPKRLLPTAPDGFEKLPGNPESDAGGVNAATAIFTKDNVRYFVSVVEYENESAAKEKGDMGGQSIDEGGTQPLLTARYLIVGRYSFKAYARSNEAEPSDLKALLGATPLSQGCVEGKAKRPKR